MNLTNAHGRARALWRLRKWQICAGIGVVTFLSMFLGRPDLVPPLMKRSIKHSLDAQVFRRFENLSESNQYYVKERYRELLSAHEQKDFARMAVEARNIFNLVDDYNDAKSYEAIARRGILEVEEARKRMDREQEIRKARELTNALIPQAEILFQRALADPSARDPYRDISLRIMVLDPGNQAVAQWSRTLHEIDMNERRSHVVRELASLEIKGEGLVSKAKKDPEARARLYEISDRIKQIDPTNLFPGEWRELIHHGR